MPSVFPVRRRVRARTSLILALAVLLAACGQITSTGDPSSAASVNGSAISIDAVEQQLEAARNTDPQLASQLDADESGDTLRAVQAEILLFLIRGELYNQAASDLGIEVTEEDIEARRQLFVDQMGGEEAYQEVIGQAGLTEEDVRAQLVPALNEERLREQIGGDAEVSDEEVRSAYEAQYVDVPNVRHILVETEDEAQEVLDRLDAGEDFNELAAEVSTDPSAVQNQGELGPLQRGQTVEPFEEAVFAAEPGEVVGPVESDFGFHVIERLAVPDFDEVADDLRAQRQAESGSAAFDEWLSEQFAEASIDVNPRFGEWDADQATVSPVAALDR